MVMPEDSLKQLVDRITAMEHRLQVVEQNQAVNRQLFVNAILAAAALLITGIFIQVFISFMRGGK